jgi:hypothetical protein
VELQLNSFLMYALNEGKWSVSYPGRFTSGENAYGTHCTGGRGGGGVPQAVWTLLGKYEFLASAGNSTESLTVHPLGQSLY